MCPSRATADELAAVGFDPSRLRIVPWGVAARPITAADRRRVAGAYGLPPRFVLFVGTVEPRKNLARLAEAVARLDPPLPLVVAGAPGWGAPASAGSAHFLGFVPASDLPALYASAAVFAYPSLHEGFGLPVVEAMSYGTPVVTSTDAATSEVAAGAAVLVDPADAGAIAAGIRAALADAPELGRRGLARAAELTWERAAAATVDVYREAVALAAERS
jgi:glycosyltransferase involved in cell wall biosynthesis